MSGSRELGVGGQHPNAGLGGAGGGWSVGVQGTVAVGAGGSDGSVGKQRDAPAPPVHGDQMVKTAQKQQIGQTGGAALGPGDDVVRLAGGRGLGAAGEAAVPVPGDDQAAQVGGDGLGGRAGVQGQAD